MRSIYRHLYHRWRPLYLRITQSQLKRLADISTQAESKTEVIPVLINLLDLARVLVFMLFLVISRALPVDVIVSDAEIDM